MNTVAGDARCVLRLSDDVIRSPNGTGLLSTQIILELKTDFTNTTQYQFSKKFTRYTENMYAQREVDVTV
jgi:hypothetical protein